MKSIKVIALAALALWTNSAGQCGVYNIAGFTFNEANSAQCAAIVDGPRNLKLLNSTFGKFSSAYLTDTSVRSNEFAAFNRSATIGWLLQPYRISRAGNLHGKFVTLGNAQKEQRSVIEISWGESAVRNKAGNDFVIFESDDSAGFAVSVLKSGASDFSRPKYQFADAHDKTHRVNGYGFDLSHFDVAEGEVITAIRIQNIFAADSAIPDKVDTVSGYGTLISANDAGYRQGFPLRKKSVATQSQYESKTANIVYVAALHEVEPFDTTPAKPGLLKLSGYTINPSNSVKTVLIVEGPANLKLSSSRSFNAASVAGFSSRKRVVETNPTVQLDPNQSIGKLLHPRNSKNPSHVMFPDLDYAPPTPNTHRSAIELTWGGNELRNKPGNDFVVYEVAEWEGFAVAVQRNGQWTPYRYQFTNGMDVARQINAVAFDLSSFGLKENETITAIRIRNLFNSKAAVGADKVDDASGQGTVIYPNNPKYKSAYPLLKKSGGKEFETELLDADIVYVIGLHDIESSTKVAAR